MKKNKMMRLASGMMVMALVTTCAISGTFAKYTTTTTGDDKARVAYWGFDQDASTTIDLFSANYNSDKVKAENNDNVIAPGTTQSSEFAFGYTNNTDKNITAPEVAYNLTVNAEITGSTTKLDADKSFTWYLQKKDDDATKKTYQTVKELETAIEALAGTGSNNGSQDYSAGELPKAFTSADETYVVGWNWAFDGNDDADTALGNDANLENVNLKITITATQKN